MTSKEIKEINREISRLRAKIARLQAEADNTAIARRYESGKGWLD